MPKFTVVRTWHNVEAKSSTDAVEKTKNTLHDEVNVVKRNGKGVYPTLETRNYNEKM